MSSAWYKNGKRIDAAALWTHIRSLELMQRTRITRDFVNEKIYSSSVGLERGTREMTPGGFMPAELNFTRTIVDALVARVGNDRPAIKFAADGADWSQRRRAKQLDKVIEGEMDHLEIPAMGPLVIRDSLVTRGGIGMVTADDDKIVADRVPAEELLFDPRESRYGKPRQLHRLMRCSKDVLAAKFPGKAAEIESAPMPEAKPNDLEQGMGLATSDLVEVAMSWHLASSDEAKDGLYAISIPGHVLDVCEYKRCRFPIAVLRWSPPRRGYWGSSLVDELASLQYKVNEVARDLMQNIYFTSAVKVLVRRSADVSKKHVAGKRPHFIEVDAMGSDLMWHAPDGFSPAQFQFLQWLIQQMFEVSGVSQLMAQGKNPLGAGASGAALNEVYQQDSERFSQLEQGYARWWCEMGELIIDAAKDMADDDDFRESEVKWAKGNVLTRIKWADVDLEEDRFDLRLEPSGFMPQTRAGKMAVLEQLVANGMIDPKWAASLIDYPDLKRAQMVQTAPLEWCLWAMEQIADVELSKDGEEVNEDKSAQLPAPDPHMDLELAMSVAKATYNIAITEGTPEPILRRYLDFMDAVDAEQKKLQAGAPAPAAAPGGPMPGAPPGDPKAAAGLPPGPMAPMAGQMPTPVVM